MYRLKPRVLFLDHSGALGGAELYLLDAAKQYRETSRVVLFEDGAFRRRLAEEGVPVSVVEGSSAVLGVRKQGAVRRGIRALSGVARLACRVSSMARHYDLLYANSQKALVVGAWAGLFARKPVIWNLHDILTADHFSFINRKIAVFCANYLTNRVIVNSRATQRAFSESGGDVSKTAVVYNGIDPASFDPISKSKRNQLRDNLGLGDNPTVGVFSRLAEWKGQHVLLEALAEIPNLHALLVGKALFGGDRSYADRLHHQASQLGIKDRVHFLGFRDDIAALMQAVDIVAHTSVAPEPFGRVIVEALMAGRPTVATRAGGAREIIEEGKTGLFVEPGDPEALANALQHLLHDPEERAAMAAAGREDVLHRFTVSRMNKALESHIKAVANS